MQIRKYLSFIDDYSGILTPIPCPPAQVALYITHLSKTLCYSSITNYLSGLNFMLKSEGQDPIDFTNFKVRSVLGGAKRTLGANPRQAAPLLPAHLRTMFSYMSDSVGDVSIRSAILTSFRGLLRKSQITLSDSTLLRSDFVFYPWGMVLKVRRSKTIQFSERELLIPISKLDNTDLCAVYWCRKHFHMTKVSGNSPAFQIPSPTGGFSPLTYKVLQATLKYLTSKLGLAQEYFSSHSLRRGGCTYLAQQGASIEEIRRRGDWKSDSVYKYIKLPLSDRIISDMRVAKVLSME